MIGSAAGVDLRIIPTKDQIAKTATVPPEQVPAYDRPLSEEDKRVASAKIIAAYKTVVEETKLFQTLQGPPSECRQMMHVFDDLQVLSLLVASLFYDPCMLGDFVMNISRQANQSAADVTQINAFLRVIWKATFSLHIDHFCLYLVEPKAQGSNIRLSIPIAHLATQDNLVALYAIGELLHRRHLFTKKIFSADRTGMCFGGFVYDQEFRYMIFRPMLTALIIQLSMQKGAASKIKSVVSTLSHIKYDWTQNQTEFRIPLSPQDLDSLDKITAILERQSVQIAELSHFTTILDVISARVRIPEATTGEPAVAATGGDGRTVAPLVPPADVTPDATAAEATVASFASLLDDDDADMMIDDEEDF